ncbi:unnamed protein product [Cylindrotheca closterium]|uniref:FAD dependent oxidoreductase domain-containing protein n=1 Tax=Cylindrotheca closterium TaxID=2856 RepID=A0AAD2FFJ4_9STRA|nr:unnamed protein product [Cylindrotheca closterium]
MVTIPSSIGPNNVGIVGGGLAGMATAFQLIKKKPSINVTIIDKALPGTGGASSVAGGLLHPLTPRGKIAAFGIQGVDSSKTLIETASEFEKGVVLRDEIYRVAVNNKHRSVLKAAASSHPQFCEWLEANELEWDTSSSSVLGALRIHGSGCKVIHVPSYLNGLWLACESRGTGDRVWALEEDCADWKERLSEFDAVVLSAGAGMFQDAVVKQELPVQLVRGQSIELHLRNRQFEQVRLCGKYATPLPDKGKVNIGATQEFKDEPLDCASVKDELQMRSYDFLSDLWDDGDVHKVTEGFRVQSDRGPRGRLPIIGSFDSELHDNAWIFTGLSSRGLLYHSLFGDMLTDMMFDSDENYQLVDAESLNWWVMN